MALVTGAGLPAGRVLALWFVGLLGGLATLTVAGVNLGDGVWWRLTFLVLWALPLGVLGAAGGSWLARRRAGTATAT